MLICVTISLKFILKRRYKCTESAFYKMLTLYKIYWHKLNFIVLNIISWRWSVLLNLLNFIYSRGIFLMKHKHIYNHCNDAVSWWIFCHMLFFFLNCWWRRNHVKVGHQSKQIKKKQQVWRWKHVFQVAGTLYCIVSLASLDYSGILACIQ